MRRFRERMLVATPGHEDMVLGIALDRFVEGRVVVCASCRDVVLGMEGCGIFAGRIRCPECYLELAHGILPDLSRAMPPARPTPHRSLTELRECSPVHENAVRAMEDPS